MYLPQSLFLLICDASVRPVLDTRLTSCGSKGAFTLQLFTSDAASFFCVHVRVLHSAVSLFFVRGKKRCFSSFAFQMIPFVHTQHTQCLPAAGWSSCIQWCIHQVIKCVFHIT